MSEAGASPGPSQNAVEAYALAVDRWLRATYYAHTFHMSESSLRFAAVGEALFWAMSLDEELHDKGGRSALCEGLRFARNRATHSLMWTVTEEPGMIFPVTLPARFSHYVWRDAAELPLPPRGQPGSGPGGEASRDAYVRAWEGRHVDQTLHDLAAHFAALVDD